VLTSAGHGDQRVGLKLSRIVQVEQRIADKVRERLGELGREAGRELRRTLDQALRRQCEGLVHRLLHGRSFAVEETGAVKGTGMRLQ
jgi:hypothetical protein